MLDGVNVAMGVTGSIAAVKCVELAHELRRQGASVRAITSPSAEGIVNPWALEFATDAPVVTELTGAVEHIELCGTDGWADVLLIAPATANTTSKIAHAIDDTPVTTCATTAIGSDLPVVLAPAMHEPMWDHPGVLDAIDQLEDWGLRFVAPRIEEGKAKIATESAIVTATATAVPPHPLVDTEVVVTAGATSEPIDAVRILTNRSSGRMGRAVAKVCAIRGADVTLVHDGPDVPFASVRQVESGAEMRSAVLDAVDTADVFVSAAAMSDFTVERYTGKLDSGSPTDISLTPEPKLLDAVRDAAPEIAIVGFKAEADPSETNLIAAARSQLERVDASFVIGNDSVVMGDDATSAVIVDPDETESYTGSKLGLAARIADRIHEI